MAPVLTDRSKSLYEAKQFQFMIVNEPLTSVAIHHSPFCPIVTPIVEENGAVSNLERCVTNCHMRHTYANFLVIFDVIRENLKCGARAVKN
jgi:hypothetical protein